jgi:hypothetical protein
MIKPKFNLPWCRQLLAKENFSTNKNRSLLDGPIFMKVFFLEPSVKTQLFYNYKNKYFDLIQKYLDEIINPNAFKYMFEYTFFECLGAK